jgi:hypothetical protein
MDLPDRLMLTVLNMANADRDELPTDGQQFVAVEIDDRHRAEWEIMPAEIDEMERRGWCELLPPGPDDPPDRAKVRLTDRADYWLRRWLKKNRHRLRELLTAHATNATQPTKET